MPTLPALPPTLALLTEHRVTEAERAWRRAKDRLELGGCLALVGALGLVSSSLPVTVFSAGLLSISVTLAVTAIRTMRRARLAVREATTAVRDPYLARAAAEVDRLVSIEASDPDPRDPIGS